MTDQVRLEVGDKVIINDYTPPGCYPAVRPYNGKVGIIRAIQTFPILSELNTDIAEIEMQCESGSITIKSPIKFLKKIEPPSPLKLEVGKKLQPDSKYKLGWSDRIHTYIGDFSKYGIPQGFKHLFIRDDGYYVYCGDSDLKEITEHRELLKEEFIGYNSFHGAKPVKCKVTFEQLPEPENE